MIKTVKGNIAQIGSRKWNLMLQLEEKFTQQPLLKASFSVSEYVQGFCNTESKRENNVLVS